MDKNPYDPKDWKHLIFNIENAIADMERIPILSVGITPYTRIIPSFFLKNYSVYTVRRSSDVDIMEQCVKMYVLETVHPELAKKVHGTGYLIGNHIFQSFIKSKIVTPQLMFYTMTEKITTDLNRLHIPWIGNDPKTFESVKTKGPFRQLVKELGLPALDSHLLAREEFLKKDFDALQKTLNGSFVVQRADKEVGGNEGTFFIHTESDLKKCHEILGADTSFEQVTVAPFIKGHSVSMLGCVMPEGTLSGPLQLQFIDVPESLHGVGANGIFFGNDLGFHPWGIEIEMNAQKVVEKIGEHLAQKGYKGVFGIDFLYDENRNEIYANECNPRFTGSLVLYSLALLESKVPPMEFFHLATHLGIQLTYDFKNTNNALKTRKDCAHISFSPKGISCMNLPLLAGVYNYNPETKELLYKNPGISLNDLTDAHDFLLIDTVPKKGEVLEQSVPRLFKFIFPKSIAMSSYAINETAAFLVEHFAQALIKTSKEYKV